ncbi:MAG TPA: RDD family protein [Candidatus Binatia bacterium]|nr:RDD family protein [Candidatus Binatia bacterium]
MGVPKAENFVLTAEEPFPDFEEPEELAPNRGWESSRDADENRHFSGPLTESEVAEETQWGGFFRRAGAFLVDILAIMLFSVVMGLMAYVGYKVGLSAHDRVMSWQNAGPLVSFLTLACTALTTLYFVLFHGMDGKTIGKWLFGLRVVGVDRRPISYRRALLRWVGTIGLGGASLGLAFLWILWQREKRGWHDLLARTWVVRE